MYSVEMIKIKKILFFDIDGTLLSLKDRTIPASAVKALQQAREQGHLVFINSGRVYIQMEDIRKQVEVDGYICGCGTYIRIGDEILYHHTIPEQFRVSLKEDIIRFGFDGVLEGMEGVVLRREASHIPEVEEFRGMLRNNVPVLDRGWEEHCYSFDKACIIGDQNSDQSGLFEVLKEGFDIIDRGERFYEIIPEGHSKATGIDVVLNHYGLDLSQAYVFGDSSNDLPMFEHVPNAVLMGEHDTELEPYASFITKSVENDGIFYAMTELGII